MAFDQIFANLATGFAATFGAPYHDAIAIWPGTPVLDSGGSIVTPGSAVELGCSAQVDRATEAMRSAADFLATDVRLLVLGLDALDDTAKITIATGPHAGVWRLMSVERDPAAIGFDCRGRKL